MLIRWFLNKHEKISPVILFLFELKLSNCFFLLNSLLNNLKFSNSLSVELRNKHYDQKQPMIITKTVSSCLDYYLDT